MRHGRQLDISVCLFVCCSPSQLCVFLCLSVSVASLSVSRCPSPVLRCASSLSLSLSLFLSFSHSLVFSLLSHLLSFVSLSLFFLFSLRLSVASRATMSIPQRHSTVKCVEKDGCSVCDRAALIFVTESENEKKKKAKESANET